MCEHNGMKLSTLRTELGLSQEELAAALGLKSKSIICEIERGSRPASLLVALKIEKWSEGKIPAASLNAGAADLAGVKPPRKRRRKAVIA